MNSKQSKICIVTTRNIFDSPCIAKYRSLLKEPFDIIYWDRCGITEECGATNYFKYHGILKPNASKVQKIRSYLGFIRFSNRLLKKYTYDKLIVFPTQMGWLIQGKLYHKYKGNYVLGIEDYAGENKFPIYHMTKKIIENSALCSITSLAYRHFLPHRDYIISHNIQHIDKELVRQYRTRERRPNQPIVLSFIGSIRFIEQQRKLISMFRNDARFQLKFIGSGSEQLEDFCRDERINNVTLIGRFERAELPTFYMETDMAINVYGNHDPYLDYALSNKLYSAAMMGMPILVSPDTYMAEISGKYGFGCCVDLDDMSTPDKVFEFYSSIDTEKLFLACDEFMELVEKDEREYINALQGYLS